MNPEQEDRPQQPAEQPLAETGNASNPTPRPDHLEPMSDNQFLTEGAEKYLREVASIEDLPDPQEQQDMDDAIRRQQTDRGE